MKRRGLFYVCVAFVLLSCASGSSLLDVDEFHFVKEPYELLGGDYTIGYLREGDIASALRCAAKSYYLYWNYRPLYSPIIQEKHKKLFEKEEAKFQYVKPAPVKQRTLTLYRDRLIVPEPDRFYIHGAGKPLLPALLSIPFLGLVKLATLGGHDLLYYQFNTNYHPLFILVRLPGIIAGLACVLLVYFIVKREVSEDKALPAAAIVAFFPGSIMCFPNIHYDAIMAPFVLVSSYLFAKGRYVFSGICFGLAMASKNAAVFMLPAMLIFIAVETIVLYRRRESAAAIRFIRRSAFGMVLFISVGVLSSLPFGNPVSQIKEILTPVTNREYDERGEDVSKHMLSEQLSPHTPPGSVTKERPEVYLLKKVIGYDASLVFVLISIPLIIERVNSPFTRYALCFFAVSFPYRIVFGSGLCFRYLMYVPFFSVLASVTLKRKALLGIILFLAVIDLVFIIDPLTAKKEGHFLAAEGTLLQAIIGASR